MPPRRRALPPGRYHPRRGRRSWVVRRTAGGCDGYQGAGLGRACTFSVPAQSADLDDHDHELRGPPPDSDAGSLVRLTAYGQGGSWCVLKTQAFWSRSGPHVLEDWTVPVHLYEVGFMGRGVLPQCPPPTRSAIWVFRVPTVIEFWVGDDGWRWRPVYIAFT